MKRAREGNPANRSINGPDELKRVKREPHPDAASRLSIEKAGVGIGLAPPLDDDPESTEALKRTGEIERRS